MDNPLDDAFDPNLQDPELLEYFSPDSATQAIVTDFVTRNTSAIIERFHHSPASSGGRIISSQILAGIIRDMLAEEDFVDPIAARVRKQDAERLERVKSSLPELDGDSLTFSWRLLYGDERPGEKWLLMLDEREILREQAYWEDYSIYLTVLDCLINKYGSRVSDFVPPSPKEHVGFVTMFGDDMGGPGTVNALRKRHFGKGWENL